VGTVHLCVMELERDRKGIPEQFLSISSPDDEGVIEDAAVHAHSTVDFGIDDGGGSDDHAAFGQIPVLAAFCNLCGVA